MSNIGLQLRQSAPQVDSIVTDYVLGYFNHLSNATYDAVQSKQLDLDSEVSFLRDLLLNAGANSEKISKVINEMEGKLSGQLKENQAKLELSLIHI